MPELQHKVLEAKAVATDLGEFTAIAAAYSVDRGKERIVPGAFKNTIDYWQSAEKMIPLHWDHESSPESIIGVVDPASMSETGHGFEVSGRLDLEGSAMAKEAWRSMKANAVALSFGYMVTEGGEGKDGIYEIKEIDLFEISVTPSPMNPDTRFIDLKNVQKPPPEAKDKVAEDEEPETGPTPKASDAEADYYEMERLKAFLPRE